MKCKFCHRDVFQYIDNERGQGCAWCYRSVDRDDSWSVIVGAMFITIILIIFTLYLLHNL